MSKYILPIGASEDAALVGGKAASLARMMRLGLNVPPGVVITTDAWREYRKLGTGLARYEFIKPIVEQAIKALPLYDTGERRMVSVRSGAPVSMPGMMDTVLNVGATFGGARAASLQGHGELAWATLARFIEMYASTTGSQELAEQVQSAFEEHEWYGSPYDESMCLAAWKALTSSSSEIDVEYALIQCVQAVLDSWYSERAIEYRAIHGIPDELGTAVTIQQMVFGNAPDTHGPSATGVLFSRNPATGENVLYGEWLENAQGEDVVAGLRSTVSMAEMPSTGMRDAGASGAWCNLFDHLLDASNMLEEEYRDMVDIEWTIENGKLWFLQCRSGKRTPDAAVRIAVEMAQAGLISKEEALARTSGVVRQVVKLVIAGTHTPIAAGVNASPGIATGVVVFSSQAAKARAALGPVILVRRMTDPQDIGGMNVAAGILTQEGGPTCHAAVVARELGKPAVVSASIQLDTTYFEAGGLHVREGDWITIDGTTGNVYYGKVEYEIADADPYLTELLSWET